MSRAEKYLLPRLKSELPPAFISVTLLVVLGGEEALAHTRVKGSPRRCCELGLLRHVHAIQVVDGGAVRLTVHQKMW